MMDETRILTEKCVSTLRQDQTVLQPSTSSTVVISTNAQRTRPQVTHQRQVSPGDCIKQRFDLLDILGVGGMGVVYRARDRRQKEMGEKEPYIALKVLSDQLQHDEAALIALQQESKRTQLLAHPNIVNVYDFDRDNDLVFMTMELLHGEPLDATLHRPDFAGEPLTAIAGKLKQMAHALNHAHENGIVHSDLKPSNVFVTESGRVKIFDFGIARVVHTTSGESLSLGALTPAYASLGMLRDKAPHPGDDLYAFALLTYFWLTGRHPYDRKTAIEVSEQCLVPAKPEGLTDSAWRTLRSALNPATTTTVSAIDFIQGLLPSPPLLGPRAKAGLFSAGILFLAIVAVVLYRSWQDYQFGLALTGNDPVMSSNALKQLSELSAGRRTRIIRAQHDALVDHALSVADSHAQVGNYYRAVDYIKEFLTLIPDSQALFERHQLLVGESSLLESSLIHQLEELEAALLGLSGEQVGVWVETLRALQAINPDHGLLGNQRLSAHLSALVHSQLFTGNRDMVMGLLSDVFFIKALPEEVGRLKALAVRYASESDYPDTASTGLLENWSGVITEDQRAFLHSEEVLMPDELESFLEKLEVSNEPFTDAFRWSACSLLLQQEREWGDSPDGKQLKTWVRALRVKHP